MPTWTSFRVRQHVREERGGECNGRRGAEGVIRHLSIGSIA